MTSATQVNPQDWRDVCAVTDADGSVCVSLDKLVSSGVLASRLLSVDISVFNFTERSVRNASLLRRDKPVGSETTMKTVL